MKNLLLTILIIFFSCMSRAQYFTIDFESPDTLVYIDTTFTGNIWQVGAPAKTFFDSAYTVPNAIVTDTLNNYPDTNLSAFTVKVYDPAWPIFLWAAFISFSYKFDTDSLQDGGYIEISWDGGTNWTNIANDPNIMPFSYDIFGNNPVIANGNAAFTGNSGYWTPDGWRWAQIGWCSPPFVPAPAPVYLRFVFSSDSIPSSKEGWMIDNIQINHVVCEGINEHTSQLITVSPNPAADAFTFTFAQAPVNAVVRLINLTGQVVFSETSVSSKSFIINVSNLTSGIYVAEIINDNEVRRIKVMKRD